MPSPNYRHAKRQKELLKKGKQEEKLKRRAAARTATDANDQPTGAGAPGDPQPADGKPDEILQRQS